MSALLDAARDAAALGYPVFPLQPRDKVPFGGTAGFKDATTDERKILHWWERWPDANVGIYPAGAGAFILDIDPKEGADPEDVFGDLDLDPGELTIVWTGEAPERSEKHPRSLTGAVGAHLYLAGEQKTARTSLAGVEVRGVGAYGLAPGSVHPCGRRYEGTLPRVTDLRPAPAVILELLSKPSSNGAGAGEAPKTEQVPPGGMHDYLLDFAVRLARAGQRDVDIIEVALVGAFERRRVPGAVYAGGRADTTRLAQWAVESEIAEREAAKEESEEEGDKVRKSQSTILIDLARRDCELWHSADGDAWATITVDGHREHHPTTGRAFKRWAQRLFYLERGAAIGGQGLRDALGALEGIAMHDGAEHPLALRVTEHDGALYLDLADREWRAVEVRGGKWRVIADSPVRFARPAAMRALPVPVPGGSLGDLRPFVNVADDRDWRLTIAFEIGSFRPRGPFPVLDLYGEQGSAKSTTARILRMLIDPNAADVRSAPREPRDVVIVAKHSWVMAIDNVSSIPEWLSDALCRLATGGGYAARALYTDSDEHVIDVMRPTILTGITEVAERGDLLDRTLGAELEPIRERVTERELYAKFERARPRILGALLDAVAHAHAHVDDVELPELPRLADFAAFVTAAEPVLGWEPGTLVKDMEANKRDLNELPLDHSVIVPAIRKVLQIGGDIEGTATEILARLDAAADQFDETVRRHRSWPKSAAALGKELTRLAPNLRGAGVWVEHWRSSSGRTRTRTWRLRADGPS